MTLNHQKDKTQFGLVLSGGGTRGMAHIGAIKAMEEYGIRPSYIAGTSSGAVVGAFYAAGYSSDEMLDFFKKTPFFSFSHYTFWKPGFLDADKFYPIFKEYFPDDRFESLQKQLFIPATDIINGQSKIFSSGQLIRPMIASAAVPGVLSPLEINGVLYSDGGILNNFPIEPLQAHCDKIIGIYLSPIKEIKLNTLKTSYSVMERAYHLATAKDSIQKFPLFDKIICPEELYPYGTFDMYSLETIFQIGYETAQRELKELIFR